MLIRGDSDTSTHTTGTECAVALLANGVHGGVVTYVHTSLLRKPDILVTYWLGLKCLVAFKHSSPDMVIKS